MGGGCFKYEMREQKENRTGWGVVAKLSQSPSQTGEGLQGGIVVASLSLSYRLGAGSFTAQSLLLGGGALVYAGTPQPKGPPSCLPVLQRGRK